MVRLLCVWYPTGERMAELIQQVMVVALLVSVMLAMGLELTSRQLLDSVRPPGPMLFTLVLNLLVVPAAAWALTRAASLPAEAAAGILLCAFSPGGGTGALLTTHARGNVAFSVALLALLSLASAFTTPLWVSVALPTPQPVEMGAVARSVLGTLVVLQVLPLAAGMALRRVSPPRADRLRRVFSTTGTVLLAVLVVGLLGRHGARALELGAAPLGVMTACVGISLGTAWVLPSSWRAAGVMTTAVRNLSTAILVATLHFPWPSVMLAILLYGLVMYLVSLAALAALR
ncbi:MAG: bile acid:sodium symporter [Myxococcota bacterium]